MNIIEANRLTGLWNNHMINSLKNFEKDTEKLYNHMNVKMANEQNKLKIKLAKDFDVLQKQIALHENDIKRLQNLSTKKAWNRGETLGELYRLKSTLKNQNEIIQNSKKIDIVAQFFKPHEMNTLGKTGFSGNTQKKSYIKGGMSTTNAISDSKNAMPSINNNKNKVMSMRTKKQLENLKKNPELIKFYIRQKFGSDIPINARLENYQQGYIDEHYKVEKYLKGSNDAGMDSSQLCHLYDDFMEEIPDKDKDDKAYHDSLKIQNEEVRKTIYDMLNLRDKRM